MSYVVLARKYRPQSFDEIIGQEHISRTLKNAIEENRVAHAYLFSGPRGVGKTTAARILAKALNCKNVQAHEPCGKCANCQEITNGSSVDVQEIDGASNRGIDEIRALRENVKFAPASLKYKIYIIDEAHQITDAAFNALLKTLEEPPSHVVFLLATTEPQKIPITILSRCQRYRFRLLSSKEIFSTLERISNAENFCIDQGALQLITESSGGSLRDSLSLLDQAVSFVSDKVTAKDIQSLLGFLPKEIISKTVDALSSQDSSEILSVIKDVAQQGYSLLQFARDLRENLRKTLLFKLNPKALDINDEDEKYFASKKDDFNTAWLIRSGHLLSRALDEMRWSDQPRLILELYMLKLSEPYVSASELLERVEQIETSGVYKVQIQEQGVQKNSVSKTPEKEGALKPSADREEEPDGEGEILQSISGASHTLQSAWDLLIKEFSSSWPRFSSMLKGASLGSISNGKITITVDSNFTKDGIKRKQEAIESALETKLGQRILLDIMVDEKKHTSEDGGVIKEEIIVDEEDEAVLEKEVFKVKEDITDTKNIKPAGLDKILNKFPGKVKKK